MSFAEEEELEALLSEKRARGRVIRENDDVDHTDEVDEVDDGAVVRETTMLTERARAAVLAIRRNMIYCLVYIY